MTIILRQTCSVKKRIMHPAILLRFISCQWQSFVMDLILEMLQVVKVYLRIDYGDDLMIRSHSTKTVISQL